jgi:hypothetical protein
MKRFTVMVLLMAGCATEGLVETALGAAPSCFADATWDDIRQVCADDVPAEDAVIVPALPTPPCDPGSTLTADGCVIQHCHADYALFGGSCVPIGTPVTDHRTGQPVTCQVTASGDCR